MIPKTIHYCWFGRNPLPESAQKCIASWRKFFPGYEIIEWNEDNFDVNSIPYTAQAYAAKKYAFVSDYARFKILYEHGGLYFDTDVEVIKSMDDIISHGAFMGFEIDFPKTNAAINPGLGMAAPKGIKFLRDIIKEYSKFQFVNADGSLNQTTIVKYTTDMLYARGLESRYGIQEVCEFALYPAEYFNPLDDNTGRLKITSSCRSIHWYSKTWNPQSVLRTKLSRWSHRILGTRLIPYLRKLLKLNGN